MVLEIAKVKDREYSTCDVIFSILSLKLWYNPLIHNKSRVSILYFIKFRQTPATLKMVYEVSEPLEESCQL